MNDNDPNLPKGLVSVHQHRQSGGWTHSRTTTYGGRLETWATIADATGAAVLWIQAHPEHEIRGVTGHPDRQILRAAGIRYVDSRRRRKSQKTKSNSYSRAKAQAAEAGVPWVDKPHKD